jgi:peptide-methionine (S)-S-oxide reductase
MAGAAWPADRSPHRQRLELIASETEADLMALPSIQTLIGGNAVRSFALVLLSLVLAPRLIAQGKAGGADLGKATFAGGCFWCMEEAFDPIPGVVSVVSGYIGGSRPNPTYEQVSAGGTGHAEAVEIRYDPAKVSYEQLLEHFWRNIDPLAVNRQFCDAGRQYRSAIFYHGAEQRQLAEASKAALERSGKLKGQIATEIVEAGPFYQAEEYHQGYYRKNPNRYKFYKWSCGRAQRLAEVWGAK